MLPHRFAQLFHARRTKFRSRRTLLRQAVDDGQTSTNIVHPCFFPVSAAYHGASLHKRSKSLLPPSESPVFVRHSLSLFHTSATQEMFSHSKSFRSSISLASSSRMI